MSKRRAQPPNIPAVFYALSQRDKKVLASSNERDAKKQHRKRRSKVMRLNRGHTNVHGVSVK